MATFQNLVFCLLKQYLHKRYVSYFVLYPSLGYIFFKKILILVHDIGMCRIVAFQPVDPFQPTSSEF